MKILDILTAPWAIQPDKLIELQAIYATHLRGEKIDIAGVEARIGKPLQNKPQGYQVVDGVAVVPLSGVIAKRMNLFSEISGGVSTELVGRDIRAAVDDPAVASILLQIDSPGGTVDGTQNLANIVAEAATKKPVVAFADGMMASAAYWIGSAASAIVAASETTQVGSIGVVATHTDVSAAEAQRGIRTTEISAGKYKRIASQYAPLSEEGRAAIQEQVDTLYTIFVNDVARQRGVAADAVLEHMADGRVFLGAEAQQRGLIDQISSFDSLVARMAAGEFPTRNRPAGVAAAVASPIAAGVAATNQPGASMNIDEIRAAHPDIAEALVQEGYAAGIKAGADAERTRILDVEAQALPGHDALIASLKADGKTTGPEAAAAVLKAERGLRTDHLNARQLDAPAPLPAAPAPDDAALLAGDSALPFDERIRAAWDRDDKVRAEFGGNFDAFRAYQQAQAGGKVRVLSAAARG